MLRSLKRLFKLEYKIARKTRNNLSFPASARKRRLSGRIGVSFTVGKDGRVEDIHLDSSSGHALLDMNVASAVRRSAPCLHRYKVAGYLCPLFSG